MMSERQSSFGEGERGADPGGGNEGGQQSETERKVFNESTNSPPSRTMSNLK